MSAVENPPAFPCPPSNPTGMRMVPGWPGMTLRDWFAGQAPITEAMALGCFGCDDGVDLTSDVTRAAFFAVYALMRYEFADAMLSERAKPSAEALAALNTETNEMVSLSNGRLA